jgi:hypothetical protein
LDLTSPEGQEDVPKQPQPPEWVCPVGVDFSKKESALELSPLIEKAEINRWISPFSAQPGRTSLHVLSEFRLCWNASILFPHFSHWYSNTGIIPPIYYTDWSF